MSGQQSAPQTVEVLPGQTSIDEIFFARARQPESEAGGLLSRAEALARGGSRAEGPVLEEAAHTRSRAKAARIHGRMLSAQRLAPLPSNGAPEPDVGG